MPHLPALLIALLLLGFNAYYLWEWFAHQLSGDVMIHLVFARNFAEGRWFEYSLGQPSRANTTILWEWILAILGLITGQIRSNEGFMTVARVFAVLCTLLAGRKLYLWGKEAGLRPGTASLTAVFLIFNPVIFYWTAVNPMETCMTLLLTTYTAAWVWRTSLADWSPGWQTQWRAGIIGALWIFALSLIRPEMLALAGVAALAFLLGQGPRRWPLALLLFAIPLALTLLQALALALGGIPIVPTPNTARRLIAMTYDTIPLPLLGIPINPDAWKVLLSWSPLLAAALIAAFFGDKNKRPAWYFALGVSAWSALFFSLYYYTTWQGRYMVPSLIALVIPALSALLTTPSGLRSHPSSFLPPTFDLRSPISFRSQVSSFILQLSSLRFLLFPYALILCALALWPLANYADAPRNRALVEEFVPPPPEARVFLVQEVQSAYWYPQLRHISTEGLITTEVYEAYKKGQTLYDFIMELRPDLIAFGRYYLDDPDGLQQKINDAALAGRDLVYRGLHLKFRGLLLGAGHHFQAEYPPEAEPKR